MALQTQNVSARKTSKLKCFSKTSMAVYKMIWCGSCISSTSPATVCPQLDWIFRGYWIFYLKCSMLSCLRANSLLCLKFLACHGLSSCAISSYPSERSSLLKVSVLILPTSYLLISNSLSIVSLYFTYVYILNFYFTCVFSLNTKQTHKTRMLSFHLCVSRPSTKFGS